MSQENMVLYLIEVQSILRKHRPQLRSLRQASPKGYKGRLGSWLRGRRGNFVTSIGINLASVNYYSTENPFIDRMHTASSWIAKDASGNNISANLLFDTHGDPTNLDGVSSLS